MKRKKEIRNIILFLSVCVVISAVAFAIMMATGVIFYDSGFHFNVEVFSGLRNQWYIYPVFILIQVVVTILLCFMPGTSATMIALGIVLFGADWECFLTCFAGVIVSSVGMDMIGRFGGEKVVKKLIDEDDYNSAMKLIREKSYTYLPFMYLLPLFPDDALCFCAGVCRINIWYHWLIIFLCRGIGCATIVFGVSVIPIDDMLPVFDHLYDWFVLLAVIIVYVYMLLKLSRFIDRKVTAMMRKKETE